MMLKLPKCRTLLMSGLLLPLAGCYVPPGQPYPYGYSADDDNGAAPYTYYGGAQVPLIFHGGSWGFYDRDRQFHRTPPPAGRNAQTHRPEGGGGRTYHAPNASQPQFRSAAAPAARPAPSQAAPVHQSHPAPANGNAPHQRNPDRRRDERGRS
jgi:hypothetical protein